MISTGLVLGYLLCAVGVIYPGVALWALWRWRKRPADDAMGVEPVTVLKPLSGDEPGLYENLRSFCDQDHPRFQIIFGAARADDTGLDVARRLREEFPQLDMTLVTAPPIRGENRKVANLVNMLARARYERLVVADSDIRVGNAYLRTVSAPLSDPDTGVVTCLYVGRPLPGLWSNLGALFINDWFLPSVLISHAFGSRAFAFGATLAFRRDALEAVGGLPELADELADDYRLGELTRRSGLNTVLSSYRVETLTNELSLGTLWRHELRWARTIKVLQPLGYAFSLLTYSLPLALAGFVLTGLSGVALTLLGITVLLRLVLHYAVTDDAAPRVLARPILIVVRDFFTLFVWGASFFGRTIWWQGRQLRLRRNGSVFEHTRRRL